MNRLIYYLIKKTLDVDIERLQTDHDILFTKNQQLSFRIKDADKEVNYRRSALNEVRKELAHARQTVEQLQQEVMAMAQALKASEQETQGVINELTALQESLLRQEETPHPTEETAPVPTEETPIPIEETTPAETPEPAVEEVPDESTLIEFECSEDDETVNAAEISPNTEETPDNTPVDIEQQTKSTLQEALSHSPYLRIRSTQSETPCLFCSKDSALKTELFTWGLEGKELIADSTVFIPYDEIESIEGVESPYVITTNKAEEIPDILLKAMCESRPIHIAYKDRNGRTAEKSLCHLSFASLTVQHKYAVLDDKHVMAKSSPSDVARSIAVASIVSVAVFDCVMSDRKTTDALANNMRQALFACRPAVAEAILHALPDDEKAKPEIIAAKAHLLVMKEDYKTALKTYLSMKAEQKVDDSRTWGELNSADIAAFIHLGVNEEQFTQLQEALCEECWGMD